MPRAKTTKKPTRSEVTKPRKRETAAMPMGEHGMRGGHASLVERNLPSLADSMTFAKMIRPNLRFLPHIRDLRWLFQDLCDRKDQATLTDIEKSRYLCAFEMINNDGTLGKLVDIHAEMHMQHTNDRLLPWHRVFVLLFEEAMHNYHPDVCVPYWDWTRTDEQHFPDWLATITPTVTTPTRTITVTRAPGPSAELDSITSGVFGPSGAMSQTTYGDFTGPINLIHGGVHVWVGGTMSDASVAAADPVF